MPASGRSPDDVDQGPSPSVETREESASDPVSRAAPGRSGRQGARGGHAEILPRQAGTERFGETAEAGVGPDAHHHRQGVKASRDRDLPVVAFRHAVPGAAAMRRRRLCSSVSPVSGCRMGSRRSADRVARSVAAGIDGSEVAVVELGPDALLGGRQQIRRISCLSSRGGGGPTATPLLPRGTPRPRAAAMPARPSVRIASSDRSSRFAPAVPEVDPQRIAV